MSDSYIEKFRKEQQDGLRKRTGEVRCDSLEAFLYQLVRDHLPAGVVESLVIEATAFSQAVMTNGYLATYSKDMAARLRSASESSSD